MKFNNWQGCYKKIESRKSPDNISENNIVTSKPGISLVMVFTANIRVYMCSLADLFQWNEEMRLGNQKNP